MLPLYRFDTLDDSAGALVHGISTRLGGASQGPLASLNLGHTVGDAADLVEANHRTLFAALGIPAERVVTAHQVHSNRVALVGGPDVGQALPETDALITDAPGVYLMLRYADCVPVLLFDPRRRAVGLAHAGWQGTVAHVAARAAEAMISHLGCHPQDILGAIGPSIGPCCYQVGPEVVARVEEAFPGGHGLLVRRQPDGHAHLDLWAANAYQLARVGLQQIETAHLCTACRTDLFYSHRAERGRTGRLAAIIGLRPVGV
jgi:polyphenol oxidase